MSNLARAVHDALDGLDEVMDVMVDYGGFDWELEILDGIYDKLKEAVDKEK